MNAIIFEEIGELHCFVEAGVLRESRRIDYSRHDVRLSEFDGIEEQRGIDFKDKISNK